jgi:hypothetical protein
MDTMTSKERVALHRARKRAAVFSAALLDGRDSVTPKQFEEAKKAEFRITYFLEKVSFARGLIAQFHSNLRDYAKLAGGKYQLVDLMDAWNRAEAELAKNAYLSR